MSDIFVKAENEIPEIPRLGRRENSHRCWVVERNSFSDTLLEDVVFFLPEGTFRAPGKGAE